MKSNLQNKLPTDHYSNGAWQTGQGNTLQSKNPADNNIIWEGRHATDAEIKAACDAANHALAQWAALDFATRSNYVRKFADHIGTKRQELAHIIALETGKPLWESLTEANAVIGKAQISIDAYQERTAAKHIETPDATASLRYKPHGVVAIFGAFNFPAHLSNGHIIPALLAGNTIVYKPSELAPAVAAFIVQCWHEIGLPAGVINCVQGDVKTGKSLLNQDIQGVYFTGSYRTGLKIHQHFSDRPEVILALEMGGNNPLVIDNVKDIDAAVYNALLSSMITAGQRCSCARRLLVPNNHTGKEFLTRFTKACQAIKIGAFTEEPEPFIGPVISYENALGHLDAQEQLMQAGGKELLRMSLLTENTGFLSPGIIDMTAVTNPADEEIFAPFVQIYRYDDFDHALMLANQTQYGLVAGLLSDDQARYQQFYDKIRAGLINWNRPTTGASSSLPFGGMGHSGNHRPSAYFAADYCAYPIASLEKAELTLPEKQLPGIQLD